MFIPSLLAENRSDVIWDLMQQNPLGALVVGIGGNLDANHLPFEIDPSNGVLRTHVARSNPLASHSSLDEAIVIFQGPNHYISPGWQPGRTKHGRVAPSWNYAVVHAYGPLRLVDDSAWLVGHLEALAEPHEAARKEPWSLAAAPPDFIEGLVKRIVGVEIKVARLLGKSQACQQYNDVTRDGVIAGLVEEGTSQAAMMATVIRSASPSQSKV